MGLDMRQWLHCMQHVSKEAYAAYPEEFMILTHEMNERSQYREVPVATCVLDLRQDFILYFYCTLYCTLFHTDLLNVS